MSVIDKPKPSQQVPAVKQPDPLNNLRSLLEQSKKQIAMAVPKHLTAERVIRVALTAINRTPKLLECEPVSVLGCVIQASELGLELSGPLGQAYMIPRKNKKSHCMEATFQVGYRGYLSLAFRSGKVSAFLARVVYDCDQFNVHYGTEDKIVHRPAMDRVGNPVAFYALLKLKDGSRDFEVMSLPQIEAHRDRYAQKPMYGDWVWDTAFDEMAKKTVIRRLAKRAPLSIEFMQAAVADEYSEAGVSQGVVLELPQPAPAPPPEGRTSLRNGNGAHTELPAPAAEGEPINPTLDPAQAPEPLDQDAAGLADLISDLDGRIESAESENDLHEVGADMNRHREWLGEEGYKERMTKYQARHKQLAPKRK